MQNRSRSTSSSGASCAVHVCALESDKTKQVFRMKFFNQNGASCGVQKMTKRGNG